jgi:hypothetical protein
LGDSFLDRGGLPFWGDSFLDTGGLPPLGHSFLDTGELPFGGTHYWVQGDSPLGDSFLDTGGLPPLGDSFLDTGGLPFGGLFPPGYRGTLSWIQGGSFFGDSFLDTGGLPHLGNSFLREESYIPAYERTPSCPFSSYPLRNSFLPRGSSFLTFGGLISFPLKLSPCQFEERDLFLPHELSSCLPRRALFLPTRVFFLSTNLVKENRIKFCLIFRRTGYCLTYPV